MVIRVHIRTLIGNISLHSNHRNLSMKRKRDRDAIFIRLLGLQKFDLLSGPREFMAAYQIRVTAMRAKINTLSGHLGLGITGSQSPILRFLKMYQGSPSVLKISFVISEQILERKIESGS